MPSKLLSKVTSLELNVSINPVKSLYLWSIIARADMMEFTLPLIVSSSSCISVNSSFELKDLTWLRKSEKFLFNVWVIFSKPRLNTANSLLNFTISFIGFAVLFAIKDWLIFWSAISCEPNFAYISVTSFKILVTSLDVLGFANPSVICLIRFSKPLSCWRISICFSSRAFFVSFTITLINLWVVNSDEFSNFCARFVIKLPISLWDNAGLEYKLLIASVSCSIFTSMLSAINPKNPL